MGWEENYEVVARLKANGKVPVTKYRSKRSGLTITLAQVEGPVVNGYFCLATEAHDDDGLPHTLEHLIFLGSKDYPYKGVLDLLANRCLSSGTNAWTDTDHTCYTMTTAGSEGFLNLLPIYMDHVLRPTLTDAGFLTEVHHVTGEGDDGGVVYCEMQGRENSGESLVHLAMLRAMYPGHCGYKSETGGIMANLRESTTNKKVQDYHREFYRPENLGLIITGQVEAEQVFAAIENIEAACIKNGEPFLRPWEGEVPKLEIGKEVDVAYPADDEDNGMVHVAWRGPSAVTNLYRMFATMILMEYLTETSVSPLQARFVETDNPLASRVGYSFIENAESTVYLIFENVPLEKIPEVVPELQTTLNDLVSGKLGWDKARLTTVINRRVMEQKSQVENSPHDAVAFMVIGDLLYGHSVEDLDIRLNSAEQFNKMLEESDSFWMQLVEELFVKSPMVVVKGKPSIKLQEEMKVEEEERVKRQKETLGKGGLQKKQEELDAAMAANEVEAPDSVLTSVPIPSSSSILFHKVTSLNSTSDQQIENFNLKQMPVFFQFDQVSSNFVYMYLVMNTDPVPQHLKPYLPLLLEMLLESPLSIDGVDTSYEEVVAQLSADCLGSSTSLGVGGSRFLPGAFAQSAVLSLQAEPGKYPDAVAWMHKLVYRTVLTPERARVLATKMENSVAELKRRGSKVVSIMMNSLLFSEESNHQVANMMKQQRFLKTLLKKLDCSPNDVIKDLEEVRFFLSKPSNMFVHMAGDLASLPSPALPWSKLLPAHVPRNLVTPTRDPEHKLTLPPPRHIAAGLGSCESAFLSRSSPAIEDFMDPDLPVLLLAIQYLTQLEGPMWRQIRGAGLAYGYFIYPSVAKGQLFMSLYKATHPVKAFVEARRIVMDQVDGKEKWDSTLLESAKSSLIFELIEKEKSLGDAVQQSLLSSFKGTSPDYNRALLAAVDKVTAADLERVAPVHLGRLFDTAQTRTTLVCGPSKLEEVTIHFDPLAILFNSKFFKGAERLQRNGN